MKKACSLIGSMLLGVAAFAAAPSGYSPADIYIAPENMIVLRLVRPDGSAREFERVLAHNGQLRSVGGWTGVEKKNTIVVRSPENSGKPEVYTFSKGRLTGYETTGFVTNYPYKAERGQLDEKYSPLLRSALPPPDPKTAAAMTKESIERERKSKWGKTGRFAIPYGNPNQTGAFWAELALSLFALFLFFTKPVERMTAAVLCLIALGCTFLSGSRGALLASALGFSVFSVPYRDAVKKHLKNKWVWLGIILGVALVLALVACKDSHFLTRGFSSGKLTWSNKVRLQMWLTAPKMMLDAPGGWDYLFFNVGRAYMDWYQPLSEVSLPGSLINDHLSALVGCPWGLRFAYLAAWGFALSLGVLCLLKRKNAFPLAMLVFWLVGCWFNPLFSAKALWLGPVAAVGVLIYALRCGSLKGVIRAGIVALSLAGIICGGIVYMGSRWKSVDAPVPVKHVGNATYVNIRGNQAPKTWVVDTTGEALGGVLSAKGVRLFYAYNPKAEPIAFVRSVQDLPSSGVERLVLGGIEGDRWLKYISKHPEARANLPDAVVFVSPPFPPQAVPPPLWQSSNVVFLVGEFAARYGEVYAEKQPGVIIVPGMEVYIENWLGLSLGVPTE